MAYFRANIQLLVEAADESEAFDAISAFLSETGVDHGIIKNWAYTMRGRHYTGVKQVELPPDYDHDETLLARLKPKKLAHKL